MNKQEELTVKRTDILSIPPALIVIVNSNIREDYPEDDFQRMKASIKEVGVKEAIHVRKLPDGTYALTHGFNRMRAVWELVSEGIEILFVPAKPAKLNEEEEVLEHLILNSGVPLTKYEISKLLIKLKAWNWSNKKMAEKTGYSLTEISNLLSFQQNASTQVKEAVASGEINITPAQKMVREAGSVDKQNEVLKKGKEAAAKNGKTKIKAKQVLEKRLTPWQKLEKIVDLIQDNPNYITNIHLSNVNRLFSLLNDNKDTAEQALKKFILNNTKQWA